MTPDGSVTASADDGLGELTSVTDGASDTSHLSYDGQGQLADAAAPDGTSERYSYDGAAQELQTFSSQEAIGCSMRRSLFTG